MNNALEDFEIKLEQLKTIKEEEDENLKKCNLKMKFLIVGMIGCLFLDFFLITFLIVDYINKDLFEMVNITIILICIFVFLSFIFLVLFYLRFKKYRVEIINNINYYTQEIENYNLFLNEIKKNNS